MFPKLNICLKWPHHSLEDIQSNVLVVVRQFLENGLPAPASQPDVISQLVQAYICCKHCWLAGAGY
jgi:hypothetical protein